MSGGTAVTLLLNGLSLAAILFLLASGLTLIFGLLEVVNFAHGAFFLVGAYVGAALIGAQVTSLPLALIAAAAVGGLAGVAVERLLLRPFYGKPLDQLLLTLGLSLVIVEGVQIVDGPDFKAISDPPFNGTVELLGGQIQTYRLLVLGLGLVVFAAMLFVLRRTRTGLVVRASIENAEMAQALRVNVGRALTGMFALGTALAFFAGAVAAPYYGGASPTLGDEHLVLAFVIAVTGGLGSFEGAALGAVVIGVASSFATFYWQPAGALVPVAIMALVLALLPGGIVAKAKARA